MNKLSANILAFLLVTLSLVTAFENSSVHAAPSNPPVVGVWSNSCLSSAIAINNTACGSLVVDTTISVQINVTNAPIHTVTGFEFFLYYDPAYLNATGVDATTGTVFSNPNVFTSALAVHGIVHIGVVCQACDNNIPNGVLVNINFKIKGTGVSPLTLAAGFAQSGFSQSYTELTSQVGGQTVLLAPNTSDGYFINDGSGKLGPVASFTFSPKSSQQGPVTFDASGSYDPDNTGVANNGIRLYIWDFGGASSQSATTASPTYRFNLGAVYGNFSARLTVVDNDNNFQGMQTRRFEVSQKPFHDLAAQSISATPPKANIGDKVAINVIVRNNGTFDENFDLVVSFSAPTTTIGTKTNQTIRTGVSLPFSFTLDTATLTPGFYILAANVTVLPTSSNPNAFENITSNNLLTTQLQILGASSSSSQLLLIVGGALAGVVALAVVGVLFRRRRQSAARL